MKKLIVIGAYPNSKKKEEILKKEIDSLQGLGYDFMIVSHYPVSPEIQSMVNYYIYDKNQILTPIDMSPYYWMNNDIFFVRVNNSRHSLPICQNMFNSFNFSEINNYDFVYFIENDNIFSENDSKKFNFLLNEMISQNKKCIFFKTVPSSRGDFDNYDGIDFLYETQIFGITPKYFNEKFRLPINIDEWINFEMNIVLEESFHKKLHTFESDFLIINDHSSNFFNESQINIFRVESFILELLHNEKNPSSVILFCHNNTTTDEIKKINITLDGELIKNETILPTHWFYVELLLDGKKLNIIVNDNEGNFDYLKTYELNVDILENIKEKGIISFT
jgi:hypothetical protein